MLAVLLLLADGRLPAGGHAHSGGIEAAVRDGVVGDLSSLRQFLLGRLATSGRMEASLAAWVTLQAGVEGAGCDWQSIDAEVSARIASPTLRDVSRTRGRQLLRVGRAAWPGETLDAVGAAAPPAGPHHCVILGVVGGVAALTPRHVASAVTYEGTTGAATAAVRLLGLDPIAVHALLAGLAPMLEGRAKEAAEAAYAGDPLSTSAPLIDLRAERHATWEERLFAS